MQEQGEVVDQIRGDDSWKYDTFIVVSADENAIGFDICRSLKQRGRFDLVDSLRLPPR